MDRRGSVCEKHGEYSATGICRWCDPVKASSPPAIGILPASKEPLTFGWWRKRYGYAPMVASPVVVQSPPPEPIAMTPAPRAIVTCACGLIRYVGDTPWQGSAHGDWFHAPAKCAPVASVGPQARSTLGTFEP